jgi:hypothetical protein
MAESVIRRIGLIATFTMIGAVVAAPVSAQSGNNVNGSGQNLAALSSSNTVIEAGGATNDDLPLDQYKAWDEFQAEHPQLAEAVSHNPRLIDSQPFLVHHPPLKEFLESHTEIWQNMKRNPGNYLPLLPQVEAQPQSHRQHRKHA